MMGCDHQTDYNGGGMTIKLIYKPNAARPYVILANGDVVFECGQNPHSWELIKSELEYLGVSNPEKPGFVK